MRYVLDTNVVSALMKGDARVLARLSQVARTAVLLPQPVLAEIEYGLQRIERSKRRDLLRSRFELITKEVGRVEWSDEVSRAFGKIKAHLEQKGQRIEDLDAAIAAHALAHGDVLVTANVKHMHRVPGLTVEDWSGVEE
jgi:tRNA(fMet)-specific endonuclease VapC